MLLTKDLYNDEKIQNCPTIGLSEKDINRYSLGRVMRSLERGEDLKDGLELEAHQEVWKRGAGQGTFTGFCVPFDVLGDKVRRDMTVGTFGNGGAMVATELGDVIPILRNKISAVRLGCNVLTGLRSTFGFPRQTSASTVSSLSETAQANDSTPTFDQPLLNPKRVAAKVIYSKQLLVQASPSVENFLRDDLMGQISLKLDSLIYMGRGSNSEPMGIFNTPGVASVNFGGTATWSKVLDFENALAIANADQDMRPGFVTTPTVRKAWKSVARALTGATTVSALPLWERGGFNDGSGDGLVNDYRAVATNQIPGDQVIFGNFRDLVLAMFGQGIELITNPYTRADQAEVIINANCYADVLLRHPQSWCVSVDSGAQ